MHGFRTSLLTPLGAVLLAATTFAACKGHEPASTSAGAANNGPAPIAPEVAAQTGAQRLTAAQYRNVVHDLFGDDIIVPAALEPDTALNGFAAIGSSFSAISPRGIGQYEDAAYKIAAQVVKAHKSAILPCTPAQTDDLACAKQFAATLGRRAFRRALSPDEVTAIASVTVAAAKKLNDVDQGLEFGIAAILQSPNFLYRVGVGEPDDAHPGKRRYTGYEMASRLSFFLWNSTPDEDLLAAAEHGLLTTDAGLASEAQRLLDSPHARVGLRNFVTEYLRLAELDTIAKDPTIFTYYSPEIGPAAREETLLDFEHLVFDDEGDYRDIFTTKSTWVNARLATIYRVAAPQADGFGLVTLPDDVPRRGLLGQVSILALYAHPTSSSATLRGKFVRTALLCATIAPPPANVNTSLPQPSATALTLRDREKQHTTDVVCAGCHRQMDPIGLGLENFDGLGSYRTTDHGALIDASGDLDGTAFKTADDVAFAVRNHPALVPCFVKKMYEYATSYVETPAEVDGFDALTYAFRTSGHHVKALMLAVATSPGFRLSGDPR